MDYLNDIFAGLALLFSGVALFLSRRGLKATRRTQKLEVLVPKAVDAAIRHCAQGPNKNLDLRTVAAHFAKNLDLEDKKRDFTDARIHAEVSAELQRRGL
jgi:hypothetical protein